MQTEADSTFSNVAATFCQCLSPIVSKLSIRDRKNIYARPLGKTYPGISKTLSQIHWFQALYVGGWGLATIDRLLTVSLVVVNIGEKLVEK